MVWLLMIAAACLVWSVSAKAQGRGEPGILRPGAAEADAPKTGSIRGRVVSAVSGEPVKGLTVGLGNAPHGSPVQTDAEGRFSWTGLVQRSYVVNLWPGAGYVARRVVADLTHTTAVAGIEVKAYRAAVITGRVEDIRRQAMAGLRVSAVGVGSVRGLYPASPRASATTNDLGEFRISDLAPGRYYVRVDLPARPVNAVKAASGRSDLPPGELRMNDIATYYPNAGAREGAAAITVSAGQVLEGINIMLARERTMCVRWSLPDAEGPRAPVVQARVESAAQQGQSALAVGSLGGGKGAAAEVCGLPSGDYRLVLEMIQDAGGGRFASVPFSLGTESIRLPQVSLQALTPVAGRLRIEGDDTPADLTGPAFFVLRPVGRAPIRGERPAASVQQQGRFTIPAVVPDDFWLSWKVPSEYYVREATIARADVARTPFQAGGAELEVLLGRDPATLSVEAVDRERGVAGAVVVLWRDLLTFPVGPGDVISGETDDRGQAVFSGLPPGTYRVFAQVDLWNDEETHTREFLAQHRADGVTVELKPNETRTVRLPVAKVEK